MTDTVTDTLSAEPIHRILTTSRDHAEYGDMFALDEATLLAGPVLDCAAGASDFALRARAVGATVVSVDPLYDSPPHQLSATVVDELERGTRRAAQVPDLYDFSWTGGLDAYLARRRHAAESFLDDYAENWSRPDGGPGHYVAAALPQLPFKDGSFALGLVPNLLFTYANLFDRAWHAASVREMLRVAPEVRIHPVTDTNGRPYGELALLLEELAADGIDSRLIDVDYRLHQGPSQTLVCRSARR
ncbi:hypothetical protein AB0M19_02030 [Streptomyces sp. NPDC051920]|uniref:hypothetical protein n=1 Tax=Streptomyces sp. NPDC051920 TaxID=3155523 RepID=UPI00343E555D